MSIAKFSVSSKLDGAGGNKRGTFTINRETNEVRVRPLGSHREYTTTLDELATLVCVLNLKAVVREEKKG